MVSGIDRRFNVNPSPNIEPIERPKADKPNNTTQFEQHYASDNTKDVFVPTLSSPNSGAMSVVAVAELDRDLNSSIDPKEASERLSESGLIPAQVQQSIGVLHQLYNESKPDALGLHQMNWRSFDMNEASVDASSRNLDTVDNAFKISSGLNATSDAELTTALEQLFQREGLDELASANLAEFVTKRIDFASIAFSLIQGKDESITDFASSMMTTSKGLPAKEVAGRVKEVTDSSTSVQNKAVHVFEQEMPSHNTAMLRV
ncbi:hypothetical protein [Algicola sagamiensis]|uniref:hypothetical protein n=1 Tax=Algicola sagamiensis TaxID=163869 RepID=UPI000367F91D|nr:hypothetical protein [Algicola sagamiensis]